MKLPDVPLNGYKKWYLCHSDLQVRKQPAEGHLQVLAVSSKCLRAVDVTYAADYKDCDEPGEV